MKWLSVENFWKIKEKNESFDQEKLDEIGTLKY